MAVVVAAGRAARGADDLVVDLGGAARGAPRNAGRAGAEERGRGRSRLLTEAGAERVAPERVAEARRRSRVPGPNALPDQVRLALPTLLAGCAASQPSTSEALRCAGKIG